MAGGIYTAQNKQRAGVFINFQAQLRSQTELGDLGVIALTLPLSWGDKVVELLSTDFVDGKSLSKIGLNVNDEEALVLRLAMSQAYKAIIYRSDTGSVQATATLGTDNPLSITAKYGGVFGNKLSVVIATALGDTYRVDTLVNGAVRQSQTIKKLDELLENDYVLFEGTGTPEVSAGVTLAGGANGTVDQENYAAALDELAKYQWNVLAVQDNLEGTRTQAIDKIDELNDRHGRYVQAVVNNAATSTNNPSIISTVSQGLVLRDGTVVTPEFFVIYLASVMAATPVNESRTYYVFKDAVDIVGAMTDDQIEDALDSGQLVLSKKQDGAIVIEKDINTLHVFSDENPYEFSKNRVIRTMFNIARWIQATYEDNYIGKVPNNEDGRSLLKADIIGHMNTLQGIGSIENFDSTVDVEVSRGEQIEGVVCNIAIQPVDSMEKLYATINVVV